MYARRQVSISWWERPTKFHHITICSLSGCPPMSTARTGSAPAETRTRVRPVPVNPIACRGTSTPSTLRVPVTLRTPCSCSAGTSISREAPGSRCSSTPVSGIRVATGEVVPSSEPMNTRAENPSPVTGSGRWVSRLGSPKRSASGNAYQSWTPCSTLVSSVENSEWVIPRPAFMRSTSPGRTVAQFPAESMWSMWPSKSQETVARPVCGWRATFMPPVAATSSGPYASRKHHAPISERAFCGSVRWTVIPRGPPRGTSLGWRSSTGPFSPCITVTPLLSPLSVVPPVPGLLPHTVGCGFFSGFVTTCPSPAGPGGAT